MIKLFVYGGCHARILCRYLAAVFDPGDLDVDLVMNYELIQSGAPFPYQRLDRCDVLVYSPVENRGDYNTVPIEAYCRERGKLTLCYPWIEWHGYCPGALKGQFKSRYQWYYPELLDIAQGFDDFRSFRDHVVARFPTDATIDQISLLSRERLAEAERRHAMAITVSDFIDAYYRDSRLFLVSDHPSRSVYIHVLQQILDRLGLAPRNPFPAGEPQGECRTPIFPRVAARMHLAFEDTDWADDVLAPHRQATFEDYLRLYFHGDGVVLAPRSQAELVARSASASITLPLDSATRIHAMPLDRDEHGDRYEYLATLAGPAIALDPRARFSVDSRQWRETWENC